MNRERILTMAKPSRINKNKKPVVKGTAAATHTHAATPHAAVQGIKPATRIEGKPSAEPTVDQIATAAYFLWLERGGNQLVNWLEAERLLRTHSPATPA